MVKYQLISTLLIIESEEVNSRLGVKFIDKINTKNYLNMGWDICSMGNHTLDISNIETLAKQLSEILKINISCKAFKDRLYEEKVDLGEIIYDEKAEWFTLWDDFYFAKSLSNKTSSELKELFSKGKIYQSDIEEIESVKRGLIKYELFCGNDLRNRDLYEICYIDIMKDFISFSIIEPFRWFGFINNLKEEVPSPYFFEFRQKNIELYQKVGATEIIYFPDQGSAQLILDRFQNSLWEEIKEYALEKKYYEECLSIPYSDPKDQEEARKAYNDKDNYLVVNLSETLRNGQIFHFEDCIDILYDDLQYVQ
ncbi:hypothetical protein ACI75Y_07885 [Capnocytophaga stomatis]|uniref:hypothetical protein n=1 Tax=Capnocytophaga stomatis TaxID=1848904 RepID=UPI001AC01FED|nr:hypothetical protein [Capnocytophaga stomatis]GIM49475.1 hypothetical protein CAPN003_09270 [Capnocytophaga stomatis]